MAIRIRYIPILLTAALLAAASAQAFFWKSDADKETDGEEAAIEIGWEDLVPAGFKPMANPLEQMSQEEVEKLLDGSDESNRDLAEIEEMMSFAPTVKELDGKRVKVPGYVVPLDFDGQTRLEEFLIVPYFGACVHTPPPPANQVVHALAKKAVEVNNTYLPVWAIGTLQTETTKSNLAEAGYKLNVERLEPYEQPQE